MGQFFRIYFPASTLLNSLTFNTEQSISIISSYLFIGSSLSVSRHIGRAVSKLKVIRKGSPIILNVIQSFSAGPASTMFDSCGNQFRQIIFFCKFIFCSCFFSNLPLRMLEGKSRRRCRWCCWATKETWCTSDKSALKKVTPSSWSS